ncbi:hypothetical protein [Lactiplantibacillus modestisalitolerans]|uniref:Uncharacterized protein n=1 Tax=Lactiplantibacillus modestisalitolerans TaxID=1457219 RepID=A0ABV5WWA6_9LACO|nr:hypothetical protein [Lactiplantibacillus modestisalitolerans]
MRIEILPARVPTALAILSIQGIDNRELNPAIEKQLATQQLLPASPQNALGDLLQVIEARHRVRMQAFDMVTLPANVDLVTVANGQVALQTATTALAPNLDAKSSRVLIIVGDAAATEEMVHATGQELQRKLKAFFGVQARLQFRTSQETHQQRVETRREDAPAD